MVAPCLDHFPKRVHARSIPHIASQNVHEVGEEKCMSDLLPDYVRRSPLIVMEKGPEASTRTRKRMGPKAVCPEEELGGEPGGGGAVPDAATPPRRTTTSPRCDARRALIDWSESMVPK